MISSPEEAISLIMKWRSSGTPLTLYFTGMGLGIEGSDVLVGPESTEQGLLLTNRSRDFSLSFKLRDLTVEPVDDPLTTRPGVRVLFAEGVSLLLSER